MFDLSFPCWNDSAVGCKHSSRFLEKNREDQPCVTHSWLCYSQARNNWLGETVINCSLGCSDPEAVELRTLREVTKEKSKNTDLGLQAGKHPHWDVMPERNIKSNKKIFCGYISSKTLKRKMQNGEGGLETMNENQSYSILFLTLLPRYSPTGSPRPLWLMKFEEGEEQLAVDENQNWCYLKKTSIYTHH